jgi:hypothetical protein
MYLHIGAQVAIPAELIVGIFDLDAVTAPSSSTVAFLARLEQENRLEQMTSELPRALVVTLERSYLSPVSAETLARRWASRADVAETEGMS